MKTGEPRKQESLPQPIIEFIAAFMRALNTARLYATSHELFKKNIQEVYAKFQVALAEEDFLFMGCAKDSLFFQGTFYQSDDDHVQKFLQAFHALRISHILFDRALGPHELEAFIGIVAGARPGQGDEISEALSQKDVDHITLGLLDYTIFSTIQMVASHLSRSSDEEAIWRLLILQPSAAETVTLDAETRKRLTRFSDDPEELKGLLQQLDTDMKEGQGVTSPAQRGALLGNFLSNLGDTLTSVAPEKRAEFALRVNEILNSLEPQLKIQVLGAVPPDSALGRDGGFMQEVFQAMPDHQVVFLLADALKETGAKSSCFHHIFHRTLAKYKDPGLVLRVIRQEMYEATQEWQPGKLGHWQQLEELFLQQQESEQLNEQYQREIKALDASVEMKVPMAEDEEMLRLRKTLEEESLMAAKARLIIDLIRNPHPVRGAVFVPPILESLGEIIRYLMREGKYRAVGTLLRAVSILLPNLPQEAQARKTLNTLLSTEEVAELLKNLMKECRNYEAEQTAAMDATSQIFPEKAGDFLTDVFMGLDNAEGPQMQWLTSSLATLGPRLSRILGRRLQDCPYHALSRLLDLIAVSSDKQMGAALEPLLDHESHDIRMKAVRTLGHLRAEHAVPRLGEILLHKALLKTKKTKMFQTAVAESLAEIGTEEAWEVLQKVVRDGAGEIKALCGELIERGGRTYDNAEQG